MGLKRLHLEQSKCGWGQRAQSNMQWPRTATAKMVCYLNECVKRQNGKLKNSLHFYCDV